VTFVPSIKIYVAGVAQMFGCAAEGGPIVHWRPPLAVPRGPDGVALWSAQCLQGTDSVQEALQEMLGVADFCCGPYWDDVIESVHALAGRTRARRIQVPSQGQPIPVFDCASDRFLLEN
jgi:hypothetical protein